MKRPILGNKYVWAVGLLVAVFGLTAISTASACYVVAKCNTDNGEDWYDWRPACQGDTVYFKGFEYLGAVEITKREWNYGDGTGWHEGGTTGSCAYTTTGAKTATYRVTADGGTLSDTCIVTVFLITEDYILWYFDGEDPTNYHIEVTWTAEGATIGTFKWEVIAGTTKVNLENDTDIITLTDDNQVGIKSTEASVSDNDVTIRFSYYNIATADCYMEVYAPASLEYIGTNHWDWGIGFLSEVYYRINDQFDWTLPDAVEHNEDWASPDTHDWLGPPVENWPVPNADGWTVDPTGWADNIGVSIPGLDPTVQNNQAPLGSEEVDHWNQEWYIGSNTVGDGTYVHINGFQRWRDHGDHVGTFP